MTEDEIFYYTSDQFNT
jgi:hypothetical protein